MRKGVSGKAHSLPRGHARARLSPMRPLIALALIPLLAACALPRAQGAATPAEPPPGVTESPGDDVMRPRARPDGDTATESAPAAPAPGPGGLLGQTLAGLGVTGGPGAWLLTGLVSAPRPGRVETPGGARLAVELRPSGAAPTAGSTISLQAMQALGLPPGQLVTLRVFAD